MPSRYKKNGPKNTEFTGCTIVGTTCPALYECVGIGGQKNVFCASRSRLFAQTYCTFVPQVLYGISF